MEADIGVIGLAVMGENLVLNLKDHGYKTAIFNRTTHKVSDFLSRAEHSPLIIGSYSLDAFVASLKRPRHILMMIQAGAAVDQLIEEIVPFLEPGDIIIDGGNSHFTDTERRVLSLRDRRIGFVGVGISGGQKGARHGPSMMVGGDLEAWEKIKPIFQTIAARSKDGAPCAEWVGRGGAGHYVKMVHNGIEYGDMQLIAELYQILKEVGGLSSSQLRELFSEWNRGELASYLLELTAHIVDHREKDGKLLLEMILDKVGEKGSGQWAAMNGISWGVPITSILEALSARALSRLKEERVEASSLYSFQVDRPDPAFSLEHAREALYGARIVNYAQGFMLMRSASGQMGWSLDYGTIALLWREGCIIRSNFLESIQDAFQRKPDLSNLLLDPFFAEEILRSLKGWRATVTRAIGSAIPIPCLSSTLTFFDGYTKSRLPSYLLQAQRDAFGAHGYERIDGEKGSLFYSQW